MNNTDLVILAGGKGTRIRKLSNYPKPIIKFNNSSVSPRPICYFS